MTPNEFKAWFDGFTEAFTGCPTKAQWTRIKARVAEIDGKPITYTVYVDRYLPQYHYYPRQHWGLPIGGLPASAANGLGALYNNAKAPLVGQAAVFNSSVAMASLGRTEARSLAAK